MKQRIYRFLILLMATVASMGIATAQKSTRTNPNIYNSRSSPGSSAFPMSDVAFLENRGQVVDARGERRPDILFTLASRQASLYLMKDRISYVFARREENTVKHERSLSGHNHDDSHDEAPYRVSELYRMDMELVGSNPQVVVESNDPVEGYTNFYLGHCPDGITGVRSFATLTYRDIYPKIDMVIRSVEGGTKCDFVVRPGGNVSDIRLRYVAADEVRLTDEGAMQAITPLGHMEEQPPYSYQGAGTERQTVASSYRIDGDMVSFEVGEYDLTRTLTIDPYSRWSTYYGGSANEGLIGGHPSEIDRSGNVLVTGYVNGNGFPISFGAFQTSGAGNNDAFIVKFNSSGMRLWATYYGGSNEDLAHGVVSDLNRNVFVTGHTLSTNFPITFGAFQTSYGGNRDAFVLKFDSIGIRRWGTYYGGSHFDDGYDVAIDNGGRLSIVMTTGNTGLGTPGVHQSVKPTEAGNASPNFDLLIAKMNSDGNRLWATYYGGNNAEYGYAGSCDNNQNIIFTGWTASSNFPTTTDAQQTTYGGNGDAFVVKLTGDGARVWATYYGGTGAENDDQTFIGGYCGTATDDTGNVFIVGSTTGDFPVTVGAMQTAYRGGEQDGFVLKLDPDGDLQWATYIGGVANDVATSIVTSSVGNITLAGFTTSLDFPVTPDADQWANGGTLDAFVTRLDNDGQLLWSTYYGGNSRDQGFGLATGDFGTTVLVGMTQSRNFPVRDPYQPSLAGSADIFLASFCDNNSVAVIDTSGPLTFLQGDSVILSVRRGSLIPRWSNGSTTDSIVVKQSGDFWVRLSSNFGCDAGSDTIHVLVTPASGITPSAGRLWPPHPNLIAGRSDVFYETVESGHIQLCIVDAIGRRIETLVDAQVASGHHHLEIDTTGLAPGMYFLTLKTPTTLLVEPLMVRR